MREKTNIRNYKFIMTVSGLVLLLLLSPCKVRNYVEYQIGVPQTEVSNKSQSTITNSGCKILEVYDAVHTSTKATFPPSDLSNANTSQLVLSFDLHHPSIYPHSSGNHPVSLVPLYILYQNFKVYS